MAPHSSTLAWKIPWTEEPGRLQSMGSWRVGHDWATWLSLFTFMHWRRKWQPTPVFLPGESQWRGSLVGCRLWGHTESDTTDDSVMWEHSIDSMGAISEARGTYFYHFIFIFLVVLPFPCPFSSFLLLDLFPRSILSSFFWFQIYALILLIIFEILPSHLIQQKVKIFKPSLKNYKECDKLTPLNSLQTKQPVSLAF